MDSSTHPAGEKNYQIVVKHIGFLTQSCSEIKTQILKGTKSQTPIEINGC